MDSEHTTENNQITSYNKWYNLSVVKLMEELNNKIIENEEQTTKNNFIKS